MKFSIFNTDKNSKARTGTIETDHGSIETPVFMPVGTLASVKGVHQHELKNEIGAQIILGNTYHLYLRPGVEVIESAGGVQKFNGWNMPMLTDSGGYQIFSLSASRKLTEEGATFQSHIDGSRHFFSPENAIDMQRRLGADIVMAFDECTPYPCEKNYAATSMHLTHRWLDRCLKQFENTEPKYNYNQSLFPIVQGSVYKDLRIQSAEYIANKNAFGNAIGGLSVGEPAEMMYEITKVVTDILPKEKPRYLMGVGTPNNILECIALGIDMFDCVLPTRNARHGLLYTQQGIINIKNEKWKNDHSVLDESGTTSSDKNYSKAYLRHLISCNELLGFQIATIHNLGFYFWLTQTAREKIKAGIFEEWKNGVVKQLAQRL